MPDPITPEVVAHVAGLARLALDGDELAAMTEKLASVLGHFADIDALDLADVEPTTQPLPIDNVLRPDEVRPCLDRDEVLAMAPDAQDGRFKVPSILGEAP